MQIEEDSFLMQLLRLKKKIYILIKQIAVGQSLKNSLIWICAFAKNNLNIKINNKYRTGYQLLTSNLDFGRMEKRGTNIQCSTHNKNTETEIGVQSEDQKSKMALTSTLVLNGDPAPRNSQNETV